MGFVWVSSMVGMCTVGYGVFLCYKTLGLKRKWLIIVEACVLAEMGRLLVLSLHPISFLINVIVHLSMNNQYLVMISTFN